MEFQWLIVAAAGILGALTPRILSVFWVEHYTIQFYWVKGKGLVSFSFANSHSLQIESYRIDWILKRHRIYGYSEEQPTRENIKKIICEVLNKWS